MRAEPMPQVVGLLDSGPLCSGHQNADVGVTGLDRIDEDDNERSPIPYSDGSVSRFSGENDPNPVGLPCHPDVRDLVGIGSA